MTRFVASQSDMVMNDDDLVNLVINLATTEIKAQKYLQMIISTFLHTLIE